MIGIITITPSDPINKITTIILTGAQEAAIKALETIN